jgi:hypothetical protein
MYRKSFSFANLTFTDDLLPVNRDILWERFTFSLPLVNNINFENLYFKTREYDNDKIKCKDVRVL